MTIFEKVLAFAERIASPTEADMKELKEFYDTIPKSERSADSEQRIQTLSEKVWKSGETPDGGANASERQGELSEEDEVKALKAAVDSRDTIIESLEKRLDALEKTPAPRWSVYEKSSSEGGAETPKDLYRLTRIPS